MLFDAAGSKDQHFVAVLCFVNVYSGTLHASDKHRLLPASVGVAFCGT
jgi:hypothetical protein